MAGMKSTGNSHKDKVSISNPSTQSAPMRIGTGKKKIEFETRVLPDGQRRYVIYSKAGGVEHLLSHPLDAYEATLTGFYTAKKPVVKKREKLEL